MWNDKYQKDVYYQEGHHGKRFDLMVKNPRPQQLIISMDYLNPRMIPDGCEEPEVHFNILLLDLTGQKIE